MKNATELRGLPRRVLALVTALLLTLSLLPGSFAVSAEETADATFYFFKADTLAGLVTYSTDRRLAANLVTITAQRAREIIAMNRAGEKPEALSETEQTETKTHVDLAEQDDLTRFDKARGSRRRGRGRGEGQQTRQRRERGDNGGAPQPRQRQPRRPKQQ